MTMPDERMRALRWGYEMLAELGDDEALPVSMRERAVAIWAAYPDQLSLQGLLRSERPSLQRKMESALADAGRLFLEVQREGAGSGETRRGLVYVLRHFPDATTIRLMGRHGALGQWIELNDGRSV